MYIFKVFAVVLTLLLPMKHVVVGDFGDLLENNPTSLLLESQLQAAIRGQEYLIKQIIRDSIYQVEFWAKQAEASQAIQATAVNAFAAKGLNDLNSIQQMIFSSDIRQCYQLNKFTFGDAISTAKTTAMQCITNKVNQGKTIVETAIANIQSAAQGITSGTQLLAECRQYVSLFPSPAGFVAKAACLSQGLITIKSAGVMLPIQLGRRVIEANEAINMIRTDAMKCGLDILSTTIERAIESGRAISNCISGSNITNV